MIWPRQLHRMLGLNDGALGCGTEVTMDGNLARKTLGYTPVVSLAEVSIYETELGT